MKELRKQAFEGLDKYNQIWVEAVKDAQKNNGELELTQIISEISTVNKILNQKFDEAEERQQSKRKGGWFK